MVEITVVFSFKKKKSCFIIFIIALKQVSNLPCSRKSDGGEHSIVVFWNLEQVLKCALWGASLFTEVYLAVLLFIAWLLLGFYLVIGILCCSI